MNEVMTGKCLRKMERIRDHTGQPSHGGGRETFEVMTST
jgi:hypothetical protein